MHDERLDRRTRPRRASRRPADLVGPVAELLGVSGAAISVAGVRERDLVASRGWDFDGALPRVFPGR